MHETEEEKAEKQWKNQNNQQKEIYTSGYMYQNMYQSQSAVYMATVNNKEMPFCK